MPAPIAKARNKNVTSIWFWLFSMFVLIIPLVNIIMTVVWAFTGENESRKNYFKALIVIFFVMMSFTLFLLSAGMLPVILEKLGMLPR